MSPLFGAVIGVTFAVGVWVIVAGLRGVTVRDNVRPRRSISSAQMVRGGVALVAWVVAWWTTGWPMAGLIAAGVVLVAPMLIEARHARARALAKTEALASWAEMLRDTISAHAGLHHAVATTARVAPSPIRSEVQSLAARAERVGLSPALRQFAAEVSDPSADLIVAALVIADERQARDLTALLGEIAGSAREQAAMRLRVETGRARTYSSSQMLVAITLLLAVGLLLFSPQFMAPYDTAAGQLVLGVIGGLFVGALAALVRMGRPVPVPRLLGGIEEDHGVSR